MALAKPIAFKGTTLGYHKIGTMEINYVTGKTTVGMLSYIDQDACDADPQNNLTGQYVVLDGVPPDLSGDGGAAALASPALGLKTVDNAQPAPAGVAGRDWAYQQVMGLDDWKDASLA